MEGDAFSSSMETEMITWKRSFRKSRKQVMFIVMVMITSLPLSFLNSENKKHKF